MMNGAELQADRQVVGQIDWEMTPDKAVEMYLEWGTGWVRGHDFVSSKSQESVYFVLFDWETPAQVTLIRRTTEAAEELAKISVPVELFRQAVADDGKIPGGGVHPLNQALKEWVCREIGGPPLDYRH